MGKSEVVRQYLIKVQKLQRETKYTHICVDCFPDLRKFEVFIFDKMHDNAHTKFVFSEYMTEDLHEEEFYKLKEFLDDYEEWNKQLNEIQNGTH